MVCINSMCSGILKSSHWPRMIGKGFMEKGSLQMSLGEWAQLHWKKWFIMSNVIGRWKGLLGV